jgi:hypothetical protein
MSKWKIIQASPPGTASTVLFNILYGLIEPELPYASEEVLEERDIIVTHECEIRDWDRYSDKYDLYFICSERKSKNRFIPNKHKHRKEDNVCIFQFEDLNETPNYPVSSIVNTVHDKLITFLPESISLNTDTAIDRINKMNKLYESIKNREFSYWDKFYGIHGSHRGRDDGV